MKPLLSLLAVMAWLAPTVAAAIEDAQRDVAAVAAASETRAVEDEQLRRELDEAQKRLEAAAREVARLSARKSGGAMERVVRYFRETGRKAMIGITIGDAPDDVAAAVAGVRIYGVSPGGPADEAGLRTGDIITAMNDQAMRADNTGSADRALLAFMKTIEPGASVRVTYSRDGQVAETTVVTEAFEPEAFRFSFDDRQSDPFEFGGDADMQRFVFRMGEDGHHGGPTTTSHLHLVPMSPGLGAYFGTEQGLLVVRAAGEGTPLQDGDVILSVDGEPANDAGRVMKRLNLLGDGQSVSVEIVRQRETLSVPLAGRSQADRGHRVIRRIEKRRIDPDSGEVEIVVEQDSD